MKVGWWQLEIADELQRFYRSLINCERPKLVLMAPPQHGKTEQVRDLIAWVAGKRPDVKTIFASYSDDLGLAVNPDLQRIMTSSRFRAIFGQRLGDRRSRWLRNSNVLEYANHRGSFRNTTVGGQITGQGLDLGIVDDPIKGRAEANSKAARDKIWDWFTDDFFTRFSDSAGLLMIMTRWHVDDPVGRFIERFPGAKILRYPAIAEEDDTNRSEGEALFPHHKSLPFLMERRAAMTRAAWESEYQQNPIVVGGGIFPIEKLTTMALLDRTNILKSVRYWDKAGTEDAGAYTAGVLIHMLKDKRFVIEHVVRGRWSALEREQHQGMGRARPRAHQEIIRDRRRAGARQRRQRIGGEHDPQPRRLQGVRRQGHGLQGGPRRAVRSSSAGRQCLAHRRPLATPIFGRARAIPERQVQGSSRRKYGRVQPARLTSELQPGRPCIMMQFIWTADPKRVLAAVKRRK